VMRRTKGAQIAALIDESLRQSENRKRSVR
jgi:hypothetical protein